MNLFKNILKKDNLYNKNFLLKIISYYIFYILFYKKYILKNNNDDNYDNNNNNNKINQIFRKKNLDLFNSKKNILNKIGYKNSSIKANMLDLPSINGITKEIIPIELELLNSIESNFTIKPIIIYNYKEDLILLDNKNKFIKFSFNYKKDLFYKIEFSFDLENVKNIIFICDNLTYNIFKNNIFIKDVFNIKLIIDNLSFDIEEKEITFYIIFYNKVILDQKDDILNNLSVINYKNIKLKNISIIVNEKVNILNNNLIFLLNINNNKYFPIYFDNLGDRVNSSINTDMANLPNINGLPKEQNIRYKIENEKVYDANESYFM
jgi:hypothetical protein